MPQGASPESNIFDFGAEQSASNVEYIRTITEPVDHTDEDLCAKLEIQNTPNVVQFRSPEAVDAYNDIVTEHIAMMREGILGRVA